MTGNSRVYESFLRFVGTRRCVWLALALAVLGLVVRCVPRLLANVSWDLSVWLLPWIQVIRENGFAAYGEAFSNYAPLYTYLLGAVSLLPQDLWMYGVKLISMTGDVALAVIVGLTVNSVCRAGDRLFRRNLGLLAGAVVLCYPTVWINSTPWGQCDVLWVGFTMLSLLMFLKDRPIWGMVAFGTALSLKMQAVFFSPVILLLLLSGRARWWQALIVPAVYVLTCVPCAIEGRSWESLLTVYFDQGVSNDEWNLNAPSVFYLIDRVPYTPGWVPVILAIVTLFALWLCVAAARMFRAMDKEAQTRMLLVFTAFCGVFFPWVLPGMHDRYMYLGDIATLTAAVALVRDRRMWVAAVLTELASGHTVVYDGLYQSKSYPAVAVGVVCATLAVVFLILSLRSAMRAGAEPKYQNNNSL